MKKMMATSVLFLVLGVGPALAQGTTLKDYYPLHVGDRWTYRALDLKAPQPKVDPKRTVEIEVEREEVYMRPTGKLDKMNNEIVEKKVGYLLKSTSAGKTTHDHVVEYGDGIHRVHAAGTPISPPLLFFKLTAKTFGETWEVDSTSGNTTIKGTFTIKSDNVTVPFAKEKMPTFLVSFRNNKVGAEAVEIDYWFAKNVGMVKQRVKTKDHEIALELEKFERAK